MTDHATARYITMGDAVTRLLRNQSPRATLDVFFGYATTRALRGVPAFKRYDAANPTDHAFLSHVFALANMPAPAMLSEKTGTVPRKAVAAAFSRAASAAGMPAGERRFKSACVRLGVRVSRRLYARVFPT